MLCPPLWEFSRKHLCDPRQSSAWHTWLCNWTFTRWPQVPYPATMSFPLLLPCCSNHPDCLSFFGQISSFLLRLHLSAFPSRLFSWRVDLPVRLPLKELLVVSSLQKALSLPTEKREGNKKGRRRRVSRMEKKKKRKYNRLIVSRAFPRTILIAIGKW